ncbi:MAG: transposase, partial [Acidobacteria bacterium]|nr:transposase [Acidobacteriota bacterium]
HRYFLTMCAFQRRRHFTSADLVNDAWFAFTRTADRQRFALIAYCFMPDHLHVLAEGLTPYSDLRAFMSIAKQRSAHAARRWIRGPLWQSGYFERVLREEEDLRDVAKYVVQNPVRAGLVRSPTDYRFLGSDILPTNDFVESTAWRPT